ncbi:MAG: 50S ribosomal protein L4 [Omnitrophica WOR_2 bacterium GWA2_47_8]|nr:MAG: 50S ribosomal protein L4 [Omnitrophica WOR_2 bacterium GWA2_47_8]
MKKLTVYNIQGKEVESIELPEGVFGERINKNVLHQAINMYRAALRQGNASTKTRSEVRGGGRKPWRQKGTGRARAGSNRSPLWHKGGVVFGPHPRDFSFSIPKKVKQAALRESLNAKYIAESICCVSDIKEKLSKTKEFVKILERFKLDGRILALLDESDQSIERVSRNIPYFEIKRSIDVNAFDILRYKKLFLTKSAFKKLLKRIEG